MKMPMTSSDKATSIIVIAICFAFCVFVGSCSYMVVGTERARAGACK